MRYFRNIKRFAEHNYILLNSPSETETSKAADIGFEFKGQYITNPWLDPSGRFPLTTQQAADTYGIVNVLSYCSEANTYIKKHSETNLERSFTRNRIDMVILAYENSTKPKETVDILVDSLGKEEASVCVATLINSISLSDGRIRGNVRKWAQSSEEAPKHAELWAMSIYGVDSYMHSANADLLGDAMMRYKD